MTQTEWKDIFANNLVDVLNEKNMTQSQLARETGLSVSRIHDYINKNATPTIYALSNIAYVLDLDIHDLANFDEFIENF